MHAPSTHTSLPDTSKLACGETFTQYPSGSGLSSGDSGGWGGPTPETVTVKEADSSWISHRYSPESSSWTEGSTRRRMVSSFSRSNSGLSTTSSPSLVQRTSAQGRHSSQVSTTRSRRTAATYTLPLGYTIHEETSEGQRHVILGKRGWDWSVLLSFLIQAYFLCFESQPCVEEVILGSRSQLVPHKPESSHHGHRDPTMISKVQQALCGNCVTGSVESTLTVETVYNL